MIEDPECGSRKNTLALRGEKVIPSAIPAQANRPMTVIEEERPNGKNWLGGASISQRALAGVLGRSAESDGRDRDRQ